MPRSILFYANQHSYFSTIVIGLFLLLINLIPAATSQGISCKALTDDSIEKQSQINAVILSQEKVDRVGFEPTTSAQPSLVTMMSTS